MMIRDNERDTYQAVFHRMGKRSRSAVRKIYDFDRSEPGRVHPRLEERVGGRAGTLQAGSFAMGGPPIA